MADQLSSLYVASLVLALIGLVVLVNALLASGLRWMGRRVSGFWRGKAAHNESRTGTDDVRRPLFDP